MAGACGHAPKLRANHPAGVVITVAGLDHPVGVAHSLDQPGLVPTIGTLPTRTGRTDKTTVRVVAVNDLTAIAGQQAHNPATVADMKAALDAAVILTAVEGYAVQAEIPYTLVGKIKYIAESAGITEARADYGAAVSMTWHVPAEQLAGFQNQIQELSGGSIVLAIDKHRWYNS